MIVDTHCHLYFDRFDPDRDAVIARMSDRDVVGAVIVGIDRQTNTSAAALADSKRFLEYSVGLHPTSSFEPRYFSADGFNAREYLADWIGGLNAPVAIGECGIDLHWDTNPLKQQQQVFRAQLQLARELGLPCIVHTREADGQTLEVLEQVPGTRGILHCFNGSPELLEFATAAANRENWFVSFAGNLTYPKAGLLRDSARQVPLRQLLVETDAPFLAPQPVRGKRCEPKDCADTAEVLASQRGVPTVEMQAILLDNSRRCFGVDWR